jgi:LuxR family transcriptional regulator, quorum-sensing system regulator CciR
MSIDSTSLEYRLKSIQAAICLNDLKLVLAVVSAEMGFTYFALTHHLHPNSWRDLKIALHNYPQEWVDFYKDLKLYKHDPILHACSLTTIGFVWNELPSIVDMTEQRLDVLRRFRQFGMGSGITVPAHVPGEPSGSCSFVTRAGQRFPVENVMAAQLIGAFAFQSARRSAGLIRLDEVSTKPLTPRQRDCLIWAMRGKTDSEIAQILGLSAETVTQHMTMARDRYGVAKRMQLAIRAIYLGDISFEEALF